jgi:hypothetical protein
MYTFYSPSADPYTAIPAKIEDKQNVFILKLLRFDDSYRGSGVRRLTYFKDLSIIANQNIEALYRVSGGRVLRILPIVVL